VEHQQRRGIFASTRVENSVARPSVLEQIMPGRYPHIRLVAEQASGDMTMQGVKGLIVLSAAIVAVALGACRREEAAPLKLGAEVPTATEVAR
jgi:hypothetical protein